PDALNRHSRRPASRLACRTARAGRIHARIAASRPGAHRGIPPPRAAARTDRACAPRTIDRSTAGAQSRKATVERADLSAVMRASELMRATRDDGHRPVIVKRARAARRQLALMLRSCVVHSAYWLRITNLGRSLSQSKAQI